MAHLTCKTKVVMNVHGESGMQYWVYPATVSAEDALYDCGAERSYSPGGWCRAAPEVITKGSHTVVSQGIFLDV